MPQADPFFVHLHATYTVGPVILPQVDPFFVPLTEEEREEFGEEGQGEAAAMFGLNCCWYSTCQLVPGNTYGCRLDLSWWALACIACGKMWGSSQAGPLAGLPCHAWQACRNNQLPAFHTGCQYVALLAPPGDPPLQAWAPPTWPSG